MRRASPSSSSNSARCSSGTCERMPAMRASTLVGVVAGAVDRQPDRAQQRVGQLERVAPGDVEAVEQPAADEVEILRHRGADVAVERAQLGERLAGVAVGVEQRASRRCRSLIAAMSRSSSPDAPADTGAAPRIIASASAGATLGPRPEVREQVADRQHRRPGEAHVLEDHLRVVLATAREIRDQLVVGERVGVDRLQLAVGLDRGRLERLVPLAAAARARPCAPTPPRRARNAAGSRRRAPAASCCTRSR